MAKKSIKKSTIDNLVKELNECDVDEIILYANDSEDRERVISLLQATNLHSAMAMIGMLIKMLAVETDNVSNELAQEIADKLKYAEEQFAKHVKKEEDKKKKKIHITVEGDD